MASIVELCIVIKYFRKYIISFSKLFSFDYIWGQSRNGKKHTEETKKERTHAKTMSLGKQSSWLLMSTISGKAKLKSYDIIFTIWSLVDNILTSDKVTQEAIFYRKSL